MFKIRRFRNEDTEEVIRVITTGLKQLLHCKKKDLGKELIENLSDIQKNYFDKGGTFFVGEYKVKLAVLPCMIPSALEALSSHMQEHPFYKHDGKMMKKSKALLNELLSTLENTLIEEKEDTTSIYQQNQVA